MAARTGSTAAGMVGIAAGTSSMAVGIMAGTSSTPVASPRWASRRSQASPRWASWASSQLRVRSGLLWLRLRVWLSVLLLLRSLPVYGAYPTVYRRYVVADYYALVVSVQKALARRGYYRGPIDGIAGKGTRRAILTYRADNGLRVISRIDNELLKAL